MTVPHPVKEEIAVVLIDETASRTPQMEFAVAEVVAEVLVVAKETVGKGTQEIAVVAPMDWCLK